MTYITRSHLEQVYGIENISAWSNLENDDAQAQETRIQAAINFAESYVDGRLRSGRYSIPFASPAPEPVRQACVLIAGDWLRGARQENASGEDMPLAVNPQAERILNLILSGRLKLGTAVTHAGPTGPVVVGATQTSGVPCGCW